MKSLLCVSLGVFALACSVEAENADSPLPPSTGGNEIQTVSHGWRINADGSVTCTFGEDDAHSQGAAQLSAPDGVGRVQQPFVVADNYGSDLTVPDNGSTPTGNRCPYVRGGSCMVPGVKSFSWNISGFNTAGNPDMTNIPYYALGDSLDYHKASTAMQWPFKTSKPRVLFVQDSTVTFAQSDIPYQQKYSSSTFGKVSASVPDIQQIRVRFNDAAIMRAARAIGISDYWSFRVYYEHVFSHEMGHVAGLGHSPNSADLMYYSTHRSNWSTNWLTDAEVQAIAAFSPGDWSNATVLDLDL